MFRHPLAVASFWFWSSAALAQWPATASNQAIGDGVGEQVLTKIAATGDGGCYVGWFDNRNGNYGVYLQRYDAAGNEQWPHGGILVSGNPQASSLVDWDLLADSQDHCVLVFTDTRAGGDLDVYAYRIAPNGTFPWGANGVALSNNSDYEPSPRVCEIASGLFAFVWANATTQTIHYQLLNGIGTAIYPADGYSIAGDPGATPGFCRVAAGTNFSFLISWVRTTTFTGNKHVHAQKIDAATGTALWNGGTRVVVFDQSSVPIAHEPRLVADRFGGACVAWHFASGSQFAVRVQHLTSSGAEVFPHNGVDVSTSANSKFDPALVWLPSSSEVLVAWNERNVGQTSWGILAQKLGIAGAPMWGPAGITLLPIDTTVKFAPVAAPLRRDDNNDAFAVSVLVESFGPQQKSVQLFGLTNNGTPAFAPVLVSTVASDKLRLAHSVTPSGTHLLAWTDLRSGNSDVYGAGVDARGTLGVTPAVTTLGGCGSNPTGSFSVSGRPAIGTTMQWTLDNPALTQPFGSLGFFFLGAGTTGFPCGIPLPGFGMSAPGAAGELLVDPARGYASWFAGTWGAPLSFPFSFPFLPVLIGSPLYVQGLLVDLTPGALVPFGLTNGARLVVGS